MDKILTIIIPTYNMEKYLRHCLNSLIVPNMDKVEVLVINDGSKDSSSAIGHEYQDKYPQTFRVIDKENGNYGSCVNRGIKEATGKYVKVLDADDSFYTKGFDEYINQLQKVDADLVLTNFDIVNENDVVTYKGYYSEYYPEIPIETNFDFETFINRPNVAFYGRMHGFTYRIDILRSMGYKQTEGVSYTDQEWVFKPVKNVKTCYYIPILLYKYLIGREGQTMNAYGKSIGQLISVVFSLIDFYETHIRGNVKCDKYFLSQIDFQLKLVYRLGLVDRGYPIQTLIEFDNQLKNHGIFYHLIDDTFLPAGPIQFKYITYWRKNHSTFFIDLYKSLKKVKGSIKVLFNKK